MEQITVTIGRNTPEGPLDGDRWDAFRTQVRRLVERAEYDVVVSNVGTGEWEGAQEDNYIVVGIRETVPFEDEIEGLAVELSVIARIYCQETIALALGASTLIPAQQKAGE